VAFFLDLKGGMAVWNSPTDYELLPNVFGCCTTLNNFVFNGGGYLAGLTLTGGSPDVIAALIPDLPEGTEDCGSNGCDVITIWTPDLQPVYVGLHSLEDRSVRDHVTRSFGVTGLNDDLLVVGSYASFQASEFRAYVGSAQLGVLDLNTLLSKQAQTVLGGTTLRTAQGINDRGWILAQTKDGTSYLLRPVPEPPSTVLLLVAGAMLLIYVLRSQGARTQLAADKGTMISKTMKCTLVALAAVALSPTANAIPVPSPASAGRAPTFRIIDLGFEGTALNNRGQVAGYSSSGAILRDRDGTIHQLGGGQAVDVNDYGQVLGNENGHAWIWDPIFGRRDFEFGGATALNDRGQFVGFVGPGVSSDFEGYLWDPIFGLTPLPALPRGVARPLDINNQGTIVGYDDAGVFGPAFVIRNGVPTILTVMEATGGVFGQSYRATAINERGHIAGFAATNNLTFPGGRDCADASAGGECNPAVLWNQDSAPDLLGVFGQALAISDRGQVVGRAVDDACLICKDAFIGAFIWDRQFGSLDINDLIRVRDPLRSVHLDWATEINNAGMVIAGTRLNGNIVDSAGRFLLVRVSEPGILSLLLLALVALGMRPCRDDSHPEVHVGLEGSPLSAQADIYFGLHNADQNPRGAFGRLETA
jgi:hypothetical protein